MFVNGVATERVIIAVTNRPIPKVHPKVIAMLLVAVVGITMRGLHVFRAVTITIPAPATVPLVSALPTVQDKFST